MLDYKAFRQIGPYLDLGFRLVLMVLLGLVGGYKLDRKLGVLPLFTLLGSMIGMAGGLFSIYRTVYGKRK